MQIPYMNKNNETVKKSSGQWTELIAELFDRLTGKGARVNYTFENLIIDIPRAIGPDGQNMGSAQCTINGRIAITAEAHDTRNANNPN
jgi:hypothetical protein